MSVHIHSYVCLFGTLSLAWAVTLAHRHCINMVASVNTLWTLVRSVNKPELPQWYCASCVSSAEHQLQHRLAHQCSYCAHTHTHIMGSYMGIGHLWLKWEGLNAGGGVHLCRWGSYGYYRVGDHSPPKACFKEPSSWLAFTGVGVQWVELTIGKWPNQCTYSHCCLVLMGHLRGFLDDRYFCTQHSFAGHSGLYCGDSLAVSISVCVWRTIFISMWTCVFSTACPVS